MEEVVEKRDPKYFRPLWDSMKFLLHLHASLEMCIFQETRNTRQGHESIRHRLPFMLLLKTILSNQKPFFESIVFLSTDAVQRPKPRCRGSRILEGDVWGEVWQPQKLAHF